jgi:hypothetical protein
MPETMYLEFWFEFLLRAEFEISPKDTAEENGNPNPQNIVSIFLSPHFQFHITELVLCPFVALAKTESVVETLKLRKTSSVRINHWSDCFDKRFGFRSRNTALRVN